MRPKLVEFRGVGIVVEGAGDQHVKIRVTGFASGGDQVGPGDRAELRADKDGGAFLGARLPIALHVAAFCAHQVARPRRERGEGDLVFLVRLLNAGGLQVFQNHLDKILRRVVPELGIGEGVNQFVILVHSQHAMGEEAFDGERAGHADDFVVLVGFVVEVLEFGLGGDRRVNFFLPGDARFPPFGVQFLRRFWPLLIRSRGISHSCQFFFSALFNFSRSGSRTACHFSQMTSISALLAMDFSVMCGTRS